MCQILFPPLLTGIFSPSPRNGWLFDSPPWWYNEYNHVTRIVVDKYFDFFVYLYLCQCVRLWQTFCLYQWCSRAYVLTRTDGAKIGWMLLERAARCIYCADTDSCDMWFFLNEGTLYQCKNNGNMTLWPSDIFLRGNYIFQSTRYQQSTSTPPLEFSSTSLTKMTNASFVPSHLLSYTLVFPRTSL